MLKIKKFKSGHEQFVIDKGIGFLSKAGTKIIEVNKWKREFLCELFHLVFLGID